ncbi:MAG TPA: hypothetical protein PKI94_08405 [Candidatus Gastranaerophilaceae bacterium]|nr:hypothetical protein [Candidatus Gastranaerophilaceae bacterium]
MGILKGYVNKENNLNRIYSREDVGKMSAAEYSKNEKAIEHQMKTIGVPTNADLGNFSDVVYVSAYTRADGTEVGAYYRSKPDGIGGSSSTTGGGNGGIMDEDPHYPWEGKGDNESKNSMKDKEEKINPLNDLLNYAVTGNFNKDQFIDHLVRNVVPDDDAQDPMGDDMGGKELLEMVKKLNKQIDPILTSVVDLLPQDSMVTDAVKSLVQYKINMGKQLEIMLDPEKRKEQQIEEMKQWVSNFADFTGQVVSGDFENIKWDEIGEKLKISQIAGMINPVAGVIATLAVDVAPKIVKLAEACNAGDKAEIIQEAIGAFTNCMGVVGQLKDAVGNKLAEFSKEVDAKIYDEAAGTYDNLEKIQNTGYRYEKFVQAEMFDQANQEALKLDDLSKNMMQGEATGFARDIKPSDLLTELKDSKNNLTLSAQIQKDVATNLPIQDLPEKYYRLSLNNLSSINTIDNDNIKVKLNELGNTSIKDFIKIKHNVSDNVDVVLPKVDSKLSQEASKSIELKSLVKDNFEAIKNNSFKNKSIGLVKPPIFGPKLKIVFGNFLAA